MAYTDTREPIFDFNQARTQLSAARTRHGEKKLGFLLINDQSILFQDGENLTKIEKDVPKFRF